MTAPPIIIIHRGDSPYLAYTIAQAKESNPESRVILLGDRSNSFYLGVEHHFYQDYFSEAEQFSKLFRYEHFPNYQYSWILFCHQKYFFLRDFCKKNNIIKLLLIDSDVLVYENISFYFRYYSNTRMTLNSHGNGPVAQAGCSVINDASVLDELCSIYISMYMKEIDKLKKEYVGMDLFTEMVGLYALMRKNPEKIINTYNKSNEMFVFNNSMTHDERYVYKGKMLKIIWKNKIPHLLSKDEDVVKTPLLHFHGKGKYKMRKYTKISNKKIFLAMMINRIFSSLAKYPMRISNRFITQNLFPKI
jgi:hypothetical protein